MATAINSRVALPIARRSGFTLMGAWLGFLVFYIVAFPKGGIKAGGVPLTVGYVFTTFLLATAMLRAKRLEIPIDRLLAFAPCLALGLWSAVVVYQNGTESLGFTISYFISVLYLPIFGLLFFSSLVLDDYHSHIERALLWAVRFIVVYGIFLFIFKQTTGKWIEIPYLTVNSADVGQLDDKFINRGGVFKLISTYNNGNIFGVSLSIIAPLYISVEKRRYLVYAMYLAMFLSLSRTVWIGISLVMISTNFSKGIRPLSILYLFTGLLIGGGIILFLLSITGTDLSFIFDKDLGGRVNQLDTLNDVRVMPEGMVSAIPEIAYLGMLQYFGIPGLFLFIAHLTMAPLLLIFEGVRILSPTRVSACVQGLLIYAVLAGADAAFSYIPVMMIFWIVAGMGFWYARRQVGLTKGVRENSR